MGKLVGPFRFLAVIIIFDEMGETTADGTVRATNKGGGWALGSNGDVGEKAEVGRSVVGGGGRFRKPAANHALWMHGAKRGAVNCLYTCKEGASP